MVYQYLELCNSLNNFEQLCVTHSVQTFILRGDALINLVMMTFPLAPP